MYISLYIKHCQTITLRKQPLALIKTRPSQRKFRFPPVKKPFTLTAPAFINWTETMNLTAGVSDVHLGITNNISNPAFHAKTRKTPGFHSLCWISWWLFWWYVIHPPKTNMDPEKMPFQTEHSSSNHWFCKGYVSFRECNQFGFAHPTKKPPAPVMLVDHDH